jgi:hypothetical protein
MTSPGKGGKKSRKKGSAVHELRSGKGNRLLQSALKRGKNVTPQSSISRPRTSLERMCGFDSTRKPKKSSVDIHLPVSPPPVYLQKPVGSQSESSTNSSKDEQSVSSTPPVHVAAKKSTVHADDGPTCFLENENTQDVEINEEEDKSRDSGGDDRTGEEVEPAEQPSIPFSPTVHVAAKNPAGTGNVPTEQLQDDITAGKHAGDENEESGDTEGGTKTGEEEGRNEAESIQLTETAETTEPPDNDYFALRVIPAECDYLTALCDYLAELPDSSKAYDNKKELR